MLGLRRYLNNEQDFAELRDPLPGEARHRAGHAGFAGAVNIVPPPPTHNHGDGAFDDAEPDVVDDDDGLEDGSEMAIDTQAPVGQPTTEGEALDAPPVPPPPPQFPNFAAPLILAADVPQIGVVHNHSVLPGAPASGIQGYEDDEDEDQAMDGTPSATASTAALLPHGYEEHPPSRSRQASGAGSIPSQAGPSTASVPGPASGHYTSLDTANGLGFMSSSQHQGTDHGSI